MPTLVEINGIDEGGKVGDNIYFVNVGIRIDAEIQLLLRNLDYFGKLFIKKEDLFGQAEKSLQKYLRDSFDDPCIRLSFFRMRVATQMQILKLYLEQLGAELFSARRTLIEEIKKWQNDPDVAEDVTATEGTSKVKIWQVVEKLKRFDQYPFMYESVIKSYGMMNITAKLDNVSDLYRTSVGSGCRYMLVVQIDGGYPFAFWWQKLLASPNLTNIKKGSAHISGVSQGDAFYPSISTAGALAYIINTYPQRAFFLPIDELTYDDKFPLDDEFYFRHTTSLTRPTFDNRAVFVGSIDPDLKSCLPYCLHRADRRKTYEPFHIEISAKSFFGEYGYGKPENTLIILGKLVSHQNKEDARFCKEEGYTCTYVADLKPHFDSLCTDVNDEIDLLPKEKKAKLSGHFETIKKKCISELT